MDQKILISYAKYGLVVLIKENENAELIERHYGNDIEAEQIHKENLVFKNDLLELSK